MRRNWMAVFVCGLFILLAAGGCEAFKEAWEEAMDPEAETTDNPNSPEFKRKYVVHLNAIVKYPRAGELEREINTFDGKTIWINTNQLFSSKNIRDAKAVARPGNPEIFDLQFKVDRFGKLQWQLLSGNHNDEPVALVVDGVYFASFYPEPADDDASSWVTLRVGINPVTARGIARNAKKNYTNLNPDTSSWF
ncbi:hypothetical protein FYJ85_06715 [Victivallaceae bacterium BBE-744-WT-12]|uniref:Lipoprotein n=1 Tax=Victivallis lenta TaxID=2606640 RepID=A0A844G1F7_9BACT|nr:hypothetical protein [Victivallis lenta]MBS1453376.1 hypothetical protein [Lentisphaeria bacterium]MBS5530776.1 hypothetical protein [bacterium]MST96735.1 hypothetical protein [Victivallis lenta]